MAEHSDTTPEPLPNPTGASDFDADDAHRAAHATEPGMGAEGETDDELDTVTGNAIDSASDDEPGSGSGSGQEFPASKPVPAEGGGPLP